jgi:hypothetical protein
MSSQITYWTNDGGMSLCNEHAGDYLHSAIQSKPNAKTHRTPMGTWERLTDEDVTYFTGKGIPCCENC